MSFIEVYKDLFVRLGPAFRFIWYFWWLWVPLVLWKMLKASWLNYVRLKYRASTQWVTLEVQIPRIIEKGPKAMEQIFANLHGFRNEPGSWLEKYRDGEVPLWYSFELASFGGELHFYVRCPRQLKNAVESNLYAQYPDIKVAEEEDYMKTRFPETLAGLYDTGYNLWGTELKLSKDEAYPIRTYKEFESKDEFENLDPVSSILELMKKLDRRENIVLHILIRPASNAWHKKGMDVVAKLKGGSRVSAAMAETAETEESVMPRTPGETQILKLMEGKLAKPGFETLIRYAYIAERSVFSPTFARRGIMSTFNQYGSESLNTFSHNFRVWTMALWVYKPYIFSKRRVEGRKVRMLRNLRERRMPEEEYLGQAFSSAFASWDFAHVTPVLNVEELATIYHYPTQAVSTAPLIERAESKTLGPPAGLPIFSGEDDSTSSFLKRT